MQNANKQSNNQIEYPGVEGSGTGRLLVQPTKHQKNLAVGLPKGQTLCAKQRGVTIPSRGHEPSKASALPPLLSTPNLFPPAQDFWEGT